MGFEEEQFGSFGDVPRKRPWYSLGNIFKFLFFGSLLASLPFALSGWSDFYHLLAEQQPPKIVARKIPSGLGPNNVELQFDISDEHSGLDQVSIRFRQGNTRKTVYEKSYEKKKNEDQVFLPFNPKDLGLVEGSVTFTVVVFDRSFWSSSKTLEFDLKIDYAPPSLNAISRQHNVAKGGVGLVFYNVQEPELALSGVVAGDRIFPGYKASLLDSDFASRPDLYFSFFSLPKSFDSQSDVISIFARDKVGNSARTNFNFLDLGKNYPEDFVDVTSEFLVKLDAALYEKYLRQEEVIKGIPKREYKPTEDIAELTERAISLLSLYQPMVEDAARELFSRPQTKRLWDSAFFYPGGSPQNPRFASKRTYNLEGRELGTFESPGVFFAAKSGSSVRAVEAGRVIFADSFGLLGLTVVVDHGFGVSTFYSNLSSNKIVEGDLVKKGETLGLTGTSALLQADGCLFQTRLFGYPVRPEEWWDASWINSRILGQIATVKKELSIASPQALPR